MKRVVVTGLGVVSSLGQDPQTFFAALLEGRSGIARLPADFNPRLRTRTVAAAAFDGAEHFSRVQMRMLDRVSQFALAAAGQAIRDAALELTYAERDDTGVFLGTGMGGAQATDDGYQLVYEQQSDRVKPMTVLLAMNNAAASWIGVEHRLCGPNLTYTTACSSSAVAIGEAFRRVARGETAVMVAGGSEAPLNFGTLMAWEAMRTLATEDADPAASCKPFALDRTGLVLGEGAAVVVLEEWERARARGAPIYAEIAGYGLTTDSQHITHPGVAGQARAMQRALAEARLPPQAIAYVNAHGTATIANDAVETAAIKAVFGECASSIPVSSTKAMHGHLLGAAGALEFVVAVLATRTGCLPPTINLRIPDPACDLDYIAEGARRDIDVGAAMSNSFAFGGTNASLVCRRYPE